MNMPDYFNMTDKKFVFKINIQTAYMSICNENGEFEHIIESRVPPDWINNKTPLQAHSIAKHGKSAFFFKPDVKPSYADNGNPKNGFIISMEYLEEYDQSKRNALVENIVAPPPKKKSINRDVILESVTQFDKDNRILYGIPSVIIKAYTLSKPKKDLNPGIIKMQIARIEKILLEGEIIFSDEYIDSLILKESRLKPV